MSIAAEIDKLGTLGLGTVTDAKTRTWALRTIFFSVTDQKARPAIDALQAHCRQPFAELKKISKELLPNDRADVPALVITTVQADNSVTKLRHYVQDWASLCVAAKHYPCAAQIRTRLWDWASERRMAVDWFLDAAYLMLCVAHPTQPCPWSYPGSFGVQGGLRSGGPIGAQLLRLRSSKPVPGLPHYNPASQNRNEYLLDVEKQLKVYCDDVEAEFKRAGFEPTIRKRQRSGPRWMHVEWFVRNRVQLWPQTKIAEQYRVAEDVVSKAVRQTANLLGFPKSRIRQ